MGIWAWVLNVNQGHNLEIVKALEAEEDITQWMAERCKALDISFSNDII